jgi:hypothetical protein
MSETLRQLIGNESESFARLDSMISRSWPDESAIDALSSHYETCLKNILSYKAETPAEAADKCRFIFQVIERDYDDLKTLKHMKDSLLRDIGSFD